MTGVGTAKDIDESIKLGLNHPMGPFKLADVIGLDTVLAIARVLHEGFGDPKYRPSPLLAKYVEAGWMGRTSGRGFYEYGPHETDDGPGHRAKEPRLGTKVQ
jgi:3-hydroxybutyryl-CoA dehydrogenase